MMWTEPETDEKDRLQYLQVESTPSPMLAYVRHLSHITTIDQRRNIFTLMKHHLLLCHAIFFLWFFVHCAKCSSVSQGQFDNILENTLHTLNGLNLSNVPPQPTCIVTSGPYSQKQICCKFAKKRMTLVKCLPNVFVVGTQKAGTTAMYYHLHAHYQVRESPAKERHLVHGDFCSPPDLSERCQKQIGFYFKKLPSVNMARVEQQVTVEVDPYYTIAKSNVVHVLRTHFPTAKIIFMVRDPVDRYFSATSMYYKMNHCHERVEHNTYMEFQLAYLKDPKNKTKVCEGMYNNLSQFGFYDSFLESLYKSYSKKEVLVIEFEEFNRDPSRILKSVYSHINIDPDVPLQDIAKNLNNFQRKNVAWGKKNNQSIPEEMRGILARQYHPRNERFFELLGKRFEHWKKPETDASVS